MKFDEAVDKFNHASFYFIQVGACDGVYVDPIYKYVSQDKWKGILLEPIPYLFELLCENYKDRDDLTLINAAVAEKECKRKMYYVEKMKISGYGGTLNKCHLGLGNFKPSHGAAEVEVDCVTLKQVVERNRVEFADLLQIDAEGFDYEIVKQIDEIGFFPTIIHYENKHLGKYSRECVDFLEARGYTVEKEGINCVAVREEPRS